MFINKFKFFILALFLAVVNVYAFIEGTIDQNYKYAWGDYLGWVNFGCDNCNVKITDNALSGYIWSENYGWINLNPENGGVKNDGKGNLSGYAWGENIGWLDFAEVKIDKSGKFQGKIKTDNKGVINFDCSYCDVRTNWRISEAGSGGSEQTKADGIISRIFGGGVGGISGPALTGKKFSVVINNDEPYTFNKVVELTLEGGDFNTYEMAISNFADFRDAKKEPYKTKKMWNLCQGIEKCSTGKYTVYAKFFVFAVKDLPITSTVGASSVVSDDIFYLEKGEPTLLPTLIDKTSSVLKKTLATTKKIIPLTKKEPKAEEKIIALTQEGSSIFDKNWRLLTYTKTEGNLIDFVAPGLTSEIKRLAAKNNFQQSTNLGFVLANILTFLTIPLKSFFNLIISLFILAIVFYSYKYLRSKKIKRKSHGSLIIENINQ
ncbi:MAG: hypothetical protein NC935_03770 [Candidatus Omnitrophica bacterium]|nr:hypothetical protein [Candidatus Omnitrophota bacterium]